MEVTDAFRPCDHHRARFPGAAGGTASVLARALRPAGSWGLGVLGDAELAGEEEGHEGGL